MRVAAHTSSPTHTISKAADNASSGLRINREGRAATATKTQENRGAPCSNGQSATRMAAGRRISP